MAATITSPATGTLAALSRTCDHSWLDRLHADPEHKQHEPNRTSRQVKSGHYVPVQPTPLRNPKLVSYSSQMAEELDLSEEECESAQFVQFFSGDINVVEGFRSWATPYALSIYGQEMYQNCPFGTGNGYGDGRAISLGEVVPKTGKRWELQLKGGGQTPFCRGADGRAVLRSSVREFLVSEAMFNLGVPTTRALSLVVSETDTVRRPWYSNSDNSRSNMPDLDDPRFASIPKEIRQAVLRQIMEQTRDPDIMITEQCAITCRVAPSFLRVGHVELFGRRAKKDPSSREELRLIVEHALFREYSGVHVCKGI